MDTKLKKWKIVLSAAAFFLGISMLLNGVCALISASTWRGVNQTWGLRDVFISDYQQTAAFRQTMSEYLNDFLAMATGGPLGWEGAYYTDEEMGEINITTFESASLGEIDAFTHYNEYPADTKTEAEWKEIYAARAQKAQEYLKEDRNVLYRIMYDNQVKFTNEASLSHNITQLPEGYNFLLYFDGQQVMITKDGAPLDVYGDGYYREDSAWRVPGYKNYTVDEETAKAGVWIAAAKSPMLYLKGNYASGNQTHQTNRLYWLEKNLRDTRIYYLGSAVCAAVGLVLLAWAFVWRKDKQLADKALARVTGRIWFECKVLLVAAAVVSVAWNGVAYTGISWNEVQDMIAYAGWNPVFGVFGGMRALLDNPAFLLVLFWIAYFLINDWRRNKQVWKHNLYHTVFDAKCLNMTLQKRLVYRAGWVFAVLTVLLLFLLFFSVMFGTTATVSTYFFADVYQGICVMLVLAALVLMFFFVKSNRAAAQDIGLLTAQIAAVRAGNLDVPIMLPQQSDLRKAAEDLNDIQQGLYKAMQEQIKSEHMKVELIANVSHDIKTPLTSVISYVELLKEEQDLPGYLKDYVRILDEKSQRLKTMVQDVFEVSKAASGDLPVKLEILDLGKLLRQTLADMSERIAQSAVLLKEDIPSAPVMVRADGQRLYRVFQNLIGNALQYSLEGSRVYITLSANGETAVASVKNTSRDELMRGMDFTERFVRGDESRSDGGSGLGLSIARSFTEACGGVFRVEPIADLFVVTVSFAQVS